MTTSRLDIGMLPSSARSWASTRRSLACSSATTCSILGPPQAEHAAQLFDRGVVVEHRADLLQREAEVPQSEETVQPAQLSDLVGPVSGVRVDPTGLEQAGLIVVPKHPGRDLPEPCELSDVQYERLSLQQAPELR